MGSRAQLVNFLVNDARVDPSIASYLTNTLEIDTISDFANFWTLADFEKGMQDDVVAEVLPFKSDMSKPTAKIQTARLRTAWRTAQKDIDGPKQSANTTKPVQGEKLIGMGWTSPSITDATIDGLWEALIFSARQPEKFMDVSDVTVADRPGFIARGLTINGKNQRVEEHIYINERKGEIVYRVVDSKTKRETDDERVIAVKEEPLRLEFFHRHVTDGFRTYWQAPVSTVEQMMKSVIVEAGKMERTNSNVVGLGVHSAEIKGVSHDAMWRAMLASIREPGRFFDCSLLSIKDCDGYVQRTMTVNGETYTEKIFEDEASHEIVYRKLVNGAEPDCERVVALRAHPMEIEFHQRNIADGFRVHWALPRSAPLSVVDVYVKEAMRMDTQKPTTIGYGVTSDPISHCSFDSIWVAIETSVRQPWKVIDVDQSSCEVKDCNGYVERRMRLNATGESVVERVVINEEIGEVVYNKCTPGGQPSGVERVLATHTPLSMEFYERNAKDGMRLNWGAPYDVARQTFDNIVKLAKSIENNSTDVVGFGLASEPMTGVTEDTLWKAMLYTIRNPQKSGMDVDRVSISDRSGYMQRSMRILGKPGSPSVTDNVRVIEGAREITYRPVINGQESEQERVFALRMDPLRCEMFNRNSRDEMRVDWQVPRSVAIQVFQAVSSVAKRMGQGEL